MKPTAHPTRLPLPISLPLVAFVALAGLLFGQSRTGRVQQESEKGKSSPNRFPRELNTSHETSVDLARSEEPGRGRGATAPWEIPWRGWKDIFVRTYRELNDDRVLAVAAGVVFYVLLAIFPTISTFVSLYAFFADPTTIREHFGGCRGSNASGCL
jgi:hypothetical protein